MDNENKNCEILFDYLKSILYDNMTVQPDLSQLDAPYEKLGKGLQYLQFAVEEMQAYAADLSKGNLSGKFPSKENFLCENLKNLHANLNHLTWQAQQVAAGDYSQHVSYLGDFSTAFNQMTTQLKEREALLIRKAEALQGYNDLLIELTSTRKEWILVVDTRTQEVLYCNKANQNITSMDTIPDHICDNCQHSLPIKCDLLNWNSHGQSVWEQEDTDGSVYQIATYTIEWKGQEVFVHIVTDITQDRRMEKALEDKAYRDAGTGIYNRHFFDEHMTQAIRERRDITLCYMDLDGLKYTNDKYGHAEGDAYIRSYVDCIQKQIRATDIFSRLGGDEFCVVFPGCCKAMVSEKIQEVLTSFCGQNQRPYPVSFSYGIMEVNSSETPMALDQILTIVDKEMYECKKHNKQLYHKQKQRSDR